jgi:competence protein ComEC
VTFGRFRVAHLGDLTWNKEFDLMCPSNPIGTVDLLVVSHHGQAISNSPVLVHALRPRVALLNNGTRKGGQPDAMKVLYSSPGLEDLWQVHFSLLSGQEYTCRSTRSLACSSPTASTTSRRACRHRR